MCFLCSYSEYGLGFQHRGGPEGFAYGIFHLSDGSVASHRLLISVQGADTCPCTEHQCVITWTHFSIATLTLNMQIQAFRARKLLFVSESIDLSKGFPSTLAASPGTQNTMWSLWCLYKRIFFFKFHHQNIHLLNISELWIGRLFCDGMLELLG